MHGTYGALHCIALYKIKVSSQTSKVNERAIDGIRTCGTALGSTTYIHHFGSTHARATRMFRYGRLHFFGVIVCFLGRWLHHQEKERAARVKLRARGVAVETPPETPVQKPGKVSGFGFRV